MHNLTLTGDEGTVRWGYHPAASLRSWSVSRDEFGILKLTASVVSSDAFRVSQSPLAFVVTSPNGSMRWPIHDLQITDGTLYARLGPKE